MERPNLPGHSTAEWNDFLRVVTLRNIAAAARENWSKSRRELTTATHLRAHSILLSREHLPSTSRGQPPGASRGLDNLASGSGFKPQRAYSKPSCSYTCLIGMALLTSPSGSLTVSDIYKSIEERFPYYKTSANPAWKNSVRHSLSLCQTFCKVEKDPNVLSWQAKKGHNWEVAPHKRPALLLEVNKGLREAGVRMKLVENGQCYQLVKISTLSTQTGRSLPIVVASPALPNVQSESSHPRLEAASQVCRQQSLASHQASTTSNAKEGHKQLDAHLLRMSAATNTSPGTPKVATPPRVTTGTAKFTNLKLPKHRVKLPSKTEANFLKIASSGLRPCGIIPMKPDPNLLKALDMHPEVTIETFADSLLAPAAASDDTTSSDAEHDSKLSEELQNTPQNPRLGPNLNRADAQIADGLSQSMELSIPGDNDVPICNAASESIMSFHDHQNAHALPKRQHVLGNEMNYSFVANSLYSASRSGMTVADRTILETELAEKTCQYIDPTNPLMKRTLTHLHWYSNPTLNAQFSDTTPFNHFKVLTLHNRTRHASQATAPFGGGFSMNTLQRSRAPPIEYGDELDNSYCIMAKAIASDLRAPDRGDFSSHDGEECSEKRNMTRVQKPLKNGHEEIQMKSRKRLRQHNEEDRLAITSKHLKLFDESTQSSGDFPAYCSLDDSAVVQSDIAAQSQEFILSLLDPST